MSLVNLAKRAPGTEMMTNIWKKNVSIYSEMNRDDLDQKLHFNFKPSNRINDVAQWVASLIVISHFFASSSAKLRTRSVHILLQHHPPSVSHPKSHLPIFISLFPPG